MKTHRINRSSWNWFFSQLCADGSKSRVRELPGITTTGWNYSQNAIICIVEQTVENYTAWQRFLPNGPIALPIGDKFSNIVWTMDPKEASDPKLMTEDDFIKAVNDALDYGYVPHPKTKSSAGSLSFLTGNATIFPKEMFETPPKVVKLSSERMMFPLSLRQANDYESKRVALVGDSAHTVHPQAGQGVNLGFADASALSKAIAGGNALGTDIGEVFAWIQSPKSHLKFFLCRQIFSNDMKQKENLQIWQ